MTRLRHLVALWVIFGILYMYFQLPPSVAEVKAMRDAQCATGKPVVVNGEVVACSDDPKRWSVWTPDHDYRDMKLVPLSKKTQEWMDADG